jgi:Flp pilus assembly protein TadD
MAYLLAWILYRRGGPASAEAATWAERALDVDPGHAKAIHLLGLLRADAGRAGEGLALLERAAALAPEDAAVRVDLGGALLAAGRGAEACRAWREARQLDAEGTYAAMVTVRLAEACQGR